ncbi:MULTISPECIES: Na+/H+ antiporter subunit G [Corallincola]|uniref:Na+/H+ antiporter subunit G n=3 Tax=Corallincola TaxID=1775176 RepID=A0A368NQE9_9GAMM|nr:MULTISPECIES: Na+/H+ antiporter subunit G [Corallincola]RCU51914.1 Na+/H+ antiporter subunit G [Corallincola holothuriorum]TAA47405.1 Na+/H+ antiporter subunit G [Corallincola spongiicola]TCI05078.1 Na+/H+ antiporter subunit G [Corallincola luteus]
MPFWIEVIASALLLLGAFFMLLGSIGLVRLPDFFTRLHAPTKATTLGIGATLLASLLMFTYQTGEFGIKELLITMFLFITAPVAAHLLAKAALHHRVTVLGDEKTQQRIVQARKQAPPVDEPLDTKVD